MRFFLIIGLGLWLSACESLMENTPANPPPRPVTVEHTEGAVEPAKQGTALSQALEKREIKSSQPVQSWQVKGSDTMIDAPPIKYSPLERQALRLSSKKEITLNFENTDIRRVVHMIMNEYLQLPYVMDPGVNGSVTLAMTSPIAKRDLLPLLETLLRMNNATLVEKKGIYHILPINMAPKEGNVPQLVKDNMPLPTGYRLIIRPLKHIAAEEMNNILQPLIKDNSIVRVDSLRNLLILAGTSQELRHMLDIISTFDVDWLKGLSVGFFALQEASAEDVLKDLDAVIGGEAGKALGGLVRIVPISSANGLLVVTPQKEYLRQIGRWIRQFDRISQENSDEPQLYIYRVRNGKAEDLANLLNQLFGNQVGNNRQKPSKKPAEVAPGLTGTTLSSKPRPPQRPKNDRTAANNKTNSSSPNRKNKNNQNKGTTNNSNSFGLENHINIVADENHNTLLIMATPRDYNKLLRTLEQLDIVPLQVHIEATIVEVLLKDELRYGIQWFFTGAVGGKSNAGGLGGAGQSLNLSGGISSLLPGFNWTLIDSTDAVRAVLTAFANDSLINVLSAPSVMVLDNHEAMIQVGDEVPILDSRQATDGGNVIENVNYRETGIILHVKPRVNPGGLVTMEISQEVSSAADTLVATNQPTIQTRKIQSTVAVQSGQTVVLGGLIRDKKTNSEDGIPGLYKLPVIGSLFGETKDSNERAELVVVLTPRVITSAEDALKITKDFRHKMQGLKEEFLIEAGVIRRHDGSRHYQQPQQDKP